MIIILKILKKLFVFKNEEVNTVAYIMLAFILITLAYDYAYIQFENMDSIVTMLYYNVVTASTVGYGDFSPQTTEGKIITMFYIPIAISLFAALISVGGAIMYGNITKKQRGIKFINKKIDFLIVGGYKTKINNLVLELTKYGKTVAVLNDLYENVPYEYKKNGISWVKGGHHELGMLKHDKIDQYIVLCDDPTDKRSDIKNSFIVEKIIERNNGNTKILVEAVEKDKYIETEHSRYIDITKATLIARESLIPGSMLAVEAVLDNGKNANQVNIITEKDMTISEIAKEFSCEVAKGNCLPIGYMVNDTWKYLSIDEIKNNQTKVAKGTKVKFVVDGEIQENFSKEKKGDTILILGHDERRVEKLITNYLKDTRFKDSKFFCNLDVGNATHYEMTDEDNENDTKFTKIAILSNLFNEESDETNFYLWGKLRKSTNTDTKILTEMTDEKNRNTLEMRHENTYNQFITYSNTGLIVQELQDSGFVKFLEDETEKCVKNINSVVDAERQ